MQFGPGTYRQNEIRGFFILIVEIAKINRTEKRVLKYIISCKNSKKAIFSNYKKIDCEA
jgi:hypothetical protein